jgi:hypothetical protein
MQPLVEHLFRFVMYVMFGLSMEVIYAMHGISMAMGQKVPRRVPVKYVEGFVSAYMIPLHGFGLLFLFEPASDAIAGFHWLLRFAIYAVGISSVEALYGWILDRVLGFYPWEYYALSKFRVFRRGYTLWTLVPNWGIAGLLLEVYTGLIRHLSPHVAGFFGL